VLYFAGGPIRAFYKIPVYKGILTLGFSTRQYHPEKKNIFIFAYNKGTEIFDLIAPFCLFTPTNKANVFIVAPQQRAFSQMMTQVPTNTSQYGQSCYHLWQGFKDMSAE
jgi:hypothetical protein